MVASVDKIEQRVEPTEPCTEVIEMPDDRVLEELVADCWLQFDWMLVEISLVGSDWSSKYDGILALLPNSCHLKMRKLNKSKKTKSTKRLAGVNEDFLGGGLLKANVGWAQRR